MSVVERSLMPARNNASWRTANSEPNAPWRRPAIVLRNIWYALRYGRPERRYERRVLKRMARGDLTNTIGIQILDEPHVRADAERWLQTLVNLGLGPNDLCVEYGCGSLWCAEPIIRRQQPGRFIGLDATDRFYEFGRQRLNGLLAEKRVGLAVISRRTLRNVAALKPALVYSHRVLHHVPPRTLRRYVRNLVSLLSERSILVIENHRRYSAADVQAHLPRNWRCRQETFGLVITRRTKA